MNVPMQMIRRLGPVVFAIAFGLASCADESPAASGSVKDRIAAGEIVIKKSEVKGSDLPKVKAMGLIKAKPEKVWAIIDRCDDYEKTMIRVESAKEVSRKGNIVRCTVTIDMPFPLSNLTATTEATHTVEPGKMYKRAWKLVEGDYKSNVGSWTLVPAENNKDHTVAVYELHAVPNISVPDAIQKAAQNKSIKNLYEHLREQLE